jgi:hypothetical protein
VSKEVTAEVKRLLEHHREQVKALLQAALQAAQQALQQAAERAAEHKVETEQLKMELAEMKVKLATLKQRPGATPPGEPQPPPAWQSNSEVQPNRQEKLLSALVEQLRGGVVEGRATQLELVGKLGNVAGKLDEVTTRLSFLEQQRRPKIGGPSRSLSTSRVSQQGKSPTFSAEYLRHCWTRSRQAGKGRRSSATSLILSHTVRGHRRSRQKMALAVRRSLRRCWR